MKSISKLFDQYEAFIVDIWGVVHDGGDVFSGTVECLQYIKRQQKPLIFLTNSPRRSAALVKLLGTKGLKSDLYYSILSSGEFFYHQAKNNLFPNFSGERPKLFCIDEFPDDYIFQGLNVEKVDSLSKADFLVVFTIPYTEGECAKYNDNLEDALKYNIPMICVNPDESVTMNGKKVIRPGFLAKIYHQKGGKVYFYGKPNSEIYRSALKLLPSVNPKKILCIGDTLSTDIQGAVSMGLDSALVIGHSGNALGCKVWCEKYPPKNLNLTLSNGLPNYYISSFSFIS